MPIIEPTLKRRAIAAARFAGAALLLNAAVTFENVWPTPAVRWRGALSAELAAAVLLLAIAGRRRRPGTPPRCNGLAFVWMILAFGRYAEVTSPALYGRDINLYWDLRLIPDVAAMAARVAPAWLLAASAAVAATVLAVAYLLMRAAWVEIVSALQQSDQPAIDRPAGIRYQRTALARRPILMAASAAALLIAAGEGLHARNPRESRFAQPVSLTYVRQARFVAEAAAGRPVAGSPAIHSTLSQVRGADVLLVFVESYGAVAFERADITRALAGSRARLASTIRDGGWTVVSGYIESPTFGGSSWLAHVSLMSGVDVRDARMNARLMTERRDTLVRLFGRRGFRTVAVMPGLRQRWPEGIFYGFDEIYSADRLAYRGPEFGWFAIPDQFSLERLEVLELRRSPRQPLFAFFPTLSTHFPFTPTPPYQPDWGRIASRQPFDGPAIVRAYAREPDWMNFTPDYIAAMAYELETLAGFLEQNARHDFVLILLGDHQPPALVAGEGASWDVPVHVITSRPPILQRLLARGFRRGLTPQAPSLGRMHAMLPVLLDVFD